MSCPTPSPHAVSCHVMYHNIMSCPVMSRHVPSCLVTSRHIPSCHARPGHATSCHICHVVPYYVLLRHVPSCHLPSRHHSLSIFVVKTTTFFLSAALPKPCQRCQDHQSWSTSRHTEILATVNTRVQVKFTSRYPGLLPKVSMILHGYRRECGCPAPQRKSNPNRTQEVFGCFTTFLRATCERT